MNLHETAMGQRFFNVQLPALINTLKDIAAALSRPAPSALSFPADPRFLTSLYYGEYEADVFKPDKRFTPFNQTVQQKEKALLPLLSSEASIAFEQYQTAVQCRNSAVLEQAYASGYRTAVQMFAAGLGPQPPIRVSVEGWEMYVKIDIADTGIGITEQHQGTIFKRFYREDAVHDVDGIGIGLYLAREIVTLQGGYIRVVSEVGKGSTFSVFLLRK